MELHPTLWRTCRVLAGVTRLRLLRQICRVPGLRVSDLATLEGIGESRASQELRRLQSRGLVQAVRMGRRVRYWPLPDPQVPAAKPLLNALETAFRRSPRSVETEGLRIASAFSHPRRLAIIQVILRGPRNFGALSGAVGFSRAALNRHLRILQARGLVERRAGGYRWKADPHPLTQCLVRLVKRRSASGG
ncbi:MAG: ArsR family transcriptional regulator [Verrucomicrobia bacterium]|nr:ArsR family transcriptional regulator [Verrucomicrobiota bacterium]MBU1909455.1 ArsR family transcriptional regulator [Verrucomicrobiota bacterium]